ncbi:hypothetical protein BaRGS_00007635 [Batillaria attramentaria]|uniref:Uncharacterized protein n=1 Tax=Batillaria attramentaria TaxID=370345 RepID=A0ABD0LPK7_9CAEN
MPSRATLYIIDPVADILQCTSETLLEHSRLGLYQPVTRQSRVGGLRDATLPAPATLCGGYADDCYVQGRCFNYDLTSIGAIYLKHRATRKLAGVFQYYPPATAVRSFN